MPKEKSNRLNEVVEAISLLKNAEAAWPTGFSNSLLKMILQRTEKELQEELFEIISKKKGRRIGVSK